MTLKINSNYCRHSDANRMQRLGLHLPHCPIYFQPFLRIFIMESDYIQATSCWFSGVTLVSTGGHVQSLLSGYKRINILLNPECLQGRAKAAAQYSPPCLSLLYGSTILELSFFFFFASFAVRWSKGGEKTAREGGKWIGVGVWCVDWESSEDSSCTQNPPRGEQAW